MIPSVAQLLGLMPERNWIPLGIKVSVQLITTAFRKRFEDNTSNAKNIAEAIIELKSLIRITLWLTFLLAKICVVQ
jgi:hypothetical protein